MTTTEQSIKTVIHHFINADGFTIIVPRIVDYEYRKTVHMMNLQGPKHEGIVENVIWQSKDPNYKWTQDVYSHLSSLIVVKEQIKARDRFNKKITLRNHEVALLDYIQGCGSFGKHEQMKKGAEALIAIKPDTRTIFQFQ